MTVGSLFAGIGGFDLGFERAGFEIKWQVEIDELAGSVLRSHWPTVRLVSDVRECGASNLERVDIICGGFPCQDISAAGRRAGIDGERSGLWAEYVRLVRELRPRYVVVENVAALLIRGIDRVLGDLAESGYDAEWEVISACYFGAPHTRERVFIVAYPACGDDGQLGEQSNDKERQPYPPRIWRGFRYEPPGCSWWKAEPSISRVDDGLSDYLDQSRFYGNAIVPQIAQWIAERIKEAETETVDERQAG